MMVLDLGVGTGNLMARLLDVGCSVCGIDLSLEMLAKARPKIPRARLICADLVGGWPMVPSRSFDRIASAYLFHGFDLGTKMRLVGRLVYENLSIGGRMIIGDIAVGTVHARDEAHTRWAGLWDEDEYYWAADEAAAAWAEANLQATYTQVADCAGVFAVRPMG